MNVRGKVAIVTGSSSGIGLATARLLSQNGAKIALAARSKEKLDVLSKDLPDSLVIPTDMTNEAEIKMMVARTKDHFGRVDILVNNAGRGYDAAVEQINPDKFREVFELDLLGAVIAMQQVFPIMRQQGEGSIINISSGTALMILPNMSAYAGLKQALAKISLTAREELKNYNISVTVVYPFITTTDFEKNTLREGKPREWQHGDGEEGLPQADTPEYVAQKILEGIQSGDAEIVVHDWMKR